MTWKDISNTDIKMVCDWCGKEAWWMKSKMVDGKLVTDLNAKTRQEPDGWSDIDTHTVINGQIDNPFSLKHICPECYLKRLG